MPYKKIELYCPADKYEDFLHISKNEHIIESHISKQDDDTYFLSFLLPSDHIQKITDTIQLELGYNPESKILIMSVDAVIPRPEEKELQKSEKKTDKQFLGVSREELLEIVTKGAKIDTNFFLLVIFSTIVAAIGLIEDNVAVVIGAMVIAPLLGPNLALAFASTLGDSSLIKQSIKTNLIGFSLCLVISVLIGYIWPDKIDSHELLIRTDVSFDGVILAIVSGAAAVLSLTKGISSVMVGVMVAVALLPPATTFGIMLGAQNYENAYGALLLLCVNIVSVNLSAKLTLLYKGVRPRTWYQQKAARGHMITYLVFWMIALFALLFIIYIKQSA